MQSLRKLVPGVRQILLLPFNGAHRADIEAVVAQVRHADAPRYQLGTGFCTGKLCQALHSCRMLALLVGCSAWRGGVWRHGRLLHWRGRSDPIPLPGCIPALARGVPQICKAL